MIFLKMDKTILYIYVSENLIDKLIEITFEISNENEYLFLFNGKSDISTKKMSF